MHIFYCDHFVLPLPKEHRFPMRKYALLRGRVASSLTPADTLLVPDAATDDQLRTVHDPGYLHRVKEGLLSPSEIRRVGFPWSQALVERSRRSVGGTVEAARAAVESGIGVNLSGGTHHAFRDRGEGYCVFNDVAVATRVAQTEGLIERAVILDLDVHQGNGTAAIFRDDPSVFTLSVHGANNFPFQKEAGNLDLELPDGTGDEAYLDSVSRGVGEALDAARPDLAFFLAGADPYRGDRLGRLAVTKEGLGQRDRIVFDRCAAAGVPVAVVMGGGYAPDLDDVVEIHFATVRLAGFLSRQSLWDSAGESDRTPVGCGGGPNPGGSDGSTTLREQ